MARSRYYTLSESAVPALSEPPPSKGQRRRRRSQSGEAHLAWARSVPCPSLLTAWSIESAAVETFTPVTFSATGRGRSNDAHLDHAALAPPSAQSQKRAFKRRFGLGRSFLRHGGHGVAAEQYRRTTATVPWARSRKTQPCSVESTTTHKSTYCTMVRHLGPHWARACKLA